MEIKIEVKTNLSNDRFERFPNMETIAKRLVDYMIDDKGLIVGHHGMHEYTYDTKHSTYDDIDKLGIIGHMTDIILDNEKLYIVADINDDQEIKDKAICFFRSKAKQSDPNNMKLDDFNIFAIDMIWVLDGDQISEDRLSEIIQ